MEIIRAALADGGRSSSSATGAAQAVAVVESNATHQNLSSIAEAPSGESNSMSSRILPPLQSVTPIAADVAEQLPRSSKTVSTRAAAAATSSSRRGGSTSRNIAIQRPPREADSGGDRLVERNRERTAVAEYDRATWRMYDLITHHRRQQQPPNERASCDEDSISSSEGEDDADEMSSAAVNLQGTRSLPTNEFLATTLVAHSAHHQIQDCSEYGDVFELDL